MKIIVANEDRTKGSMPIWTDCGMQVWHKTESDLQNIVDVIGNSLPVCPDCLQTHFKKDRTKHTLRKQYKEMEKDFRIALGGVDILIRRQRYTGESGIENSEGSFPFIPYDTGTLFQQLKAVRLYLEKEERWSGNTLATSYFLDAGCGIGNVLLQAKMHGLCSYRHGIEYYKHSADRAEALLNSKRGANNFKSMRRDFKIMRKDILKFRGYSKYDVVYFYCPFVDRRLQVMFEERLEDSMKVGAVLIANMKHGNAIARDDRFERIKVGPSGWQKFSGIYIKVKKGRRKVFDSNQSWCRTSNDINEQIIKKYNLSHQKMDI